MLINMRISKKLALGIHVLEVYNTSRFVPDICSGDEAPFFFHVFMHMNLGY